ncbi:hypothetical protein A2159_01575, partial [Candidatus Woesebacteria bacterium RBG_13_34_9]
IRKGNLVSMYFYAPLYYWSLKRKPDLVIDCSNTIYWQTPLWALKSKKVAYLNQLAKEVFDYEFPKYLAVFGKILEKVQYFTYKTTPFFCYSQSTKEDLVSMGIPEKNISIFPLGIDHSRYVPGRKSKSPLFVCVSRLVRMKRIDLVIRAMKLVRQKYKNTKLIIIGYGYQRKELELLRNKLELQKNVLFHDENILFFNYDPKDVKVKAMQTAWAHIFPSVKEGWGMTVTESAACRTPTIATNVSGLKDSVISEKTGIMISANPSEQELVKAMIRIIKDHSLREKLAKNSRIRSKEFTWEKSYKDFETKINYLFKDK